MTASRIHQVPVHEQGAKSILATAPANLSGQPFTVTDDPTRDYTTSSPTPKGA